MKALLKRLWHLALVGAGLVIPTLAALSDNAHELGRYGGPGLVGIAAIGVFVNVAHTWRPPESAAYKRWFSLLGTIANVVTPILVFVYTRMPQGTKGYLLIGTACALGSSWKGAFGSMGRGATPQAEQPKLQVVKDPPDDGPA